MAQEYKVEIQVKVTEGYNTVFAHQELKVLDSFSKEKVLESLTDFASDMQVLVNRTRHIQKVEDSILKITQQEV